MEEITQNNVSKLLVEIIPEFNDAYKEFQEDQDKEDLIHLLFGNYLLPFTLKEIENKNNKILKKIGEFLSKCFDSGDKNIDNVLHVSFFENMKKDHFEELSQYLSEKLVAHMKDMDKKHGYFV